MVYDVIIIGAGPAGISASLYTKRANLNTLIIYFENSSLEKAKLIENYYGFENGIDGKTLYETGIKQAKNLGVEVKKEELLKIELDINDGKTFFVLTTTQNQYIAKTIVLAIGTKKNKVKIKGVKECAVISLKDEERGHMVGVYIVGDASAIDVDALKDAISRECSIYARPKEVYFVKELPHTLIGKVDYKVLEKRHEHE